MERRALCRGRGKTLTEEGKRQYQLEEQRKEQEYEKKRYAACGICHREKLAMVHGSFGSFPDTGECRIKAIFPDCATQVLKNPDEAQCGDDYYSLCPVCHAHLFFVPRSG